MEFPLLCGTIFSEPSPSNLLKAKIGILGCGWLGLPLAIHFIEQGYEVHGSTTSQEKINLLNEKGINPFLLSFNPQPEQADEGKFFEVSILIINIPPSLRKKPPGFHSQQVFFINSLIKNSNVKKVIFISSTSVYPDDNRIIDESTDLASHTHELLKAENILRENKEILLNVLRCGGLMGYDRIPGKYFAGKKNLPEGDKPVNYVHRDDVINVINDLVIKDIWDETFNVVAPIHPAKRDIVFKTAMRFNLPKPHFASDDIADYKIVKAEKIKDLLEYNFKYPDPMEFYYEMD